MTHHSLLIAFDGPARIATGSPSEMIRLVSTYLREKPEAQPLVFDTETGKPVDLDLRTPSADSPSDDPARAGKGRPKLGVVAREVTLLPRHWEWLANQPGGASVTLRKLIERASKDPTSKEHQQARATAAYHFMHAVAGNLPGFEEASRLLFAGNIGGLEAAIRCWPGDIPAQVLALIKAGNPTPSA